MSGSDTGPARAKDKNCRNPWFWVPSLYFAQGIPYVVVMTLSVVMYKRLGISNTDIAFYTSLLYLPWVLKPLWSPAVDLIRTKRQWILVMQLAVALGMALAGIVLQSTLFFTLSLVCFWAMALMSSTHDIAADGFYMLGLSQHDQTWFVGVRSTFYRLAMIVGSGLLVMLAGYLEGKNGLDPVEFHVKVEPGAKAVPIADLEKARRSVDGEPVQIIVMPSNIGVGSTNASELTSQAIEWNKKHGFYGGESPSVPKTGEPSFWNRHFGKPISKAWHDSVAEPLKAFLTDHFPIKPSSRNAVKNSGYTGIVYLSLSKPPERPVVVNCGPKPRGLARLGLGSADNGFKIATGERIVFTQENWNQPCMVAIQSDSKPGMEGAFVTRAGNIPMAWSITLLTLAVIFFVFCIWHAWVLPRPVADGPVSSGGHFGAEFVSTLSSFFKKPGILPALAFILLYRFAEAQSVKLLTPFMLDDREKGGLGLSTGQVGFAYGTVGVMMLTLGGLLGGFIAARYGLKKVMPWMVCAIHMPNIALVYLAFMQPENYLTVNACVGIEQFGYGFGFTAYMLYLLHFADGEHKTAHYAICTGFMALGMMLPGFFAGWLQEVLGYRQFFVWVMLATIPGFLVAFLVKVDPLFGRKATS